MPGLDCDVPSMHLFDRRHSPRAVDGSPTWRVQPGMEGERLGWCLRAFLPGTHSTARNDSAEAVDSFRAELSAAIRCDVIGCCRRRSDREICLLWSPSRGAFRFPSISSWTSFS